MTTRRNSNHVAEWYMLGKYHILFSKLFWLRILTVLRQELSSTRACIAAADGGYDNECGNNGTFEQH